MDSSTAEKLQTFFSRYKESYNNKGAILIQGHEEPTGVIQLLEGEVAQYDISNDGQKLVVNIFRPGAFFPMSWAINKTPNTYFFEALKAVRYRKAPADETVAFLLQNPDVLLNLLGRVYRGTDGLLKRMTYLMVGDARSRLLFELFIVCQRFGKEERDGGCTVEIKESDLAAYTGLSRETVSRMLHKLKDEGLLKQQRGKITIAHVDDLKRALNLE